ncbi:hypothetical protein KZO01_17930 [Kurthia zopfii]|uniref:Uncharacterized protein n=1 Tax=Kurthia zopfii TaxID=1650 RepID=A0A2U3AAI9_9BACL|nr:hypothetical protein [Kurthia zopfii]PWI21547.1 hypothetical protein DF281_11580 [Kurthia zopfii]TDR34975.1 hypothetical protein DFR61_13310 [Kurthia zopfii]STX09635.1 Uncharacterised protein [Kurthia zopfii]VEI08240.1 Uncharacterised protein [Kurthia zopfii]GEK31484.1 hypothetical protein KZO01_17930 [Kurthia zopfii]
MFIRVFLEASTENEAMSHLQNLLKISNQIKLPLNREKCAPFQDLYEVELEGSPSEKQMMDLLESISPKWHRLPNSLIAANNENHLHVDHIDCIEVFLD